MNLAESKLTKVFNMLFNPISILIYILATFFVTIIYNQRMPGAFFVLLAVIIFAIILFFCVLAYNKKTLYDKLNFKFVQHIEYKVVVAIVLVFYTILSGAMLDDQYIKYNYACSQEDQYIKYNYACSQEDQEEAIEDIDDDYILKYDDKKYIYTYDKNNGEQSIGQGQYADKKYVDTGSKNKNDRSFTTMITDKTGYQVHIIDSACGTFWYQLLKTNNGKTWKVHNEDPFMGEGGEVNDMSFINKNIGFLCLSRCGGDYSQLYRTDDGGVTFTKLEIPKEERELSEGEYYTPFVYPSAPYYNEAGELLLYVGQGANGDYMGGREALFKSDDKGVTWYFVREMNAVIIR